MKKINLYTLVDSGLDKDKAKKIISRLGHYLESRTVQILRPIVLKNKLTTTTITIRSFQIKDIENLIEERLLDPKANFNQWIELKILIMALKNVRD